MKLDILDVDRLIEVNKLKEVTSPRLFSNRLTFDPDGILSNEIFGISKSDRRGTFAYIDLKRPFIHPHIYGNVLKRMFHKIKYIVSGQKRYVVIKGELTESPDGWTGIQGLYDHWEEIDWKKQQSSNRTAIELLSKLPKNKVFLTKEIVSPPAYRDVMLAGTKDTSDHVNEVNELYIRLIRAVALLSEGGLFARTQYATQMKIQDTLLDINNYYKSQLSKKSGLIRKYLIGKNTDFGVRSVISAYNYNKNTIQENMVDMEHTAIPISQCCSIFYPFVESWLKNFFTREIINDPNLVSYYDEDNDKYVVGQLHEPELQFSDRRIKKMINDYLANPDNRFTPINVDVTIPGFEDRKARVSMRLVGKVIVGNTVSDILKRPMTVTDILYLACVDVAEKRHCMISRYPVRTDKEMVFTKIRVQSTREHIKIIFNGKEYPYYPKIDLDTRHEMVGVQFIDTLVFSNSFLEGMGKRHCPYKIS